MEREFAAGRLLAYPITMPIEVAWSSDSRLIAVTSYVGSVYFLNAITGSLVMVYHSYERGYDVRISRILPLAERSPDGRYIAGKRFIVSARTADLSPNGRYIALSVDRTVQVWDIKTRKEVFTYHGHGKRVLAVAWSPNGSRIASTSYDNTIQIWQAPSPIEGVITFFRTIFPAKPSQSENEPRTSPLSRKDNLPVPSETVSLTASTYS
jgi:WD40 repeat protein